MSDQFLGIAATNRSASAPAIAKPHALSTAAGQRDYARVADAIRYLEAHYQEQPNLNDVAAAVHLSPTHFQRMFRAWAGISPKRFLQYLTIEYAKQQLIASRSVLDAAYDAGLSGPGRLHDLFVTVEAMTPGEYKAQGQGMHIDYGFHATPFGTCLLAATTRGICGLSFVNPGSEEEALHELRARWTSAHLEENSAATAPLVKRIFPLSSSAAPSVDGNSGGTVTHPTQPLPKVTLLLKGTNFQIKVWEALLRMPPGMLCTYGDLATRIGQPKAARAVGSAVGANGIAYIIPCHRVIRSSGLIGDYHWGRVRKKAMLGWEAAHLETA